MNGIINGSSLFNNTGIFPNNKKVKADAYKTGKNIESKDKRKAFKQELDSVDISGASREVPQAGYSKPSMRITDKTEEETKYAPIDSDGIQEGVKLSDKAKNLLKDLQEKYGDDMDIYVANWNSDAEQDYYAGLSNKRFNALINPELLEKMANDEKVREKYESILASAKDRSDKITEELGEEITSNIKSFTVSVDADGNVSYIVQLLKDFTKKNQKSSQDIQKEQKERLEEKKADEKAREKKKEKEEQYETLKASSLEELITMIKDKYNTSPLEEATASESDNANE